MQCFSARTPRCGSSCTTCARGSLQCSSWTTRVCSSTSSTGSFPFASSRTRTAIPTSWSSSATSSCTLSPLTSLRMSRRRKSNQVNCVKKKKKKKKKKRNKKGNKKKLIIHSFLLSCRFKWINLIIIFNLIKEKYILMGK